LGEKVHQIFNITKLILKIPCRKHSTLYIEINGLTRVSMIFFSTRNLGKFPENCVSLVQILTNFAIWGGGWGIPNFGHHKIEKTNPHLTTL